MNSKVTFICVLGVFVHVTLFSFAASAQKKNGDDAPQKEDEPAEAKVGENGQSDTDANGENGENVEGESAVSVSGDGTEGEHAEVDEGTDFSGNGEGSGFQRSGRMEFDERLVKGQAAKSGAVYLFQRTPRRLPGLVPFRRSYRTRIVEPVLGKREMKPPVYSDGEVKDSDEESETEIATDDEVVKSTVPEPSSEDDEVEASDEGEKKKTPKKKRKKKSKQKKLGRDK